MTYQPGNKLWEARSSHGRKPIFATPEDLGKACQQYFEWVEANPLWEEKLFAFQGDVTRARVDKIRPMTESGLCLFLDIAQSTWDNYKNKSDFLEVTARVEKIIYNQKFAGATAELMNPNIIARDLGLVDKKENTNTHKFEDMTDDQLKARIAAMQEEEG